MAVGGHQYLKEHATPVKAAATGATTGPLMGLVALSNMH